MYKAQYLLIADTMQPIQSGKVNVLGVFDSIYPPKLPFQFPAFTVVVLIVATDEDDLGDRKMVIRIEGPGKEVISETGGPVKFEPKGDSPWLSSMRIAAQITGLPIRRMGRHRIVILVNGKEVAEHGILVRERPVG